MTGCVDGRAASRRARPDTEGNRSSTVETLLPPPLRVHAPTHPSSIHLPRSFRLPGIASRQDGSRRTRRRRTSGPSAFSAYYSPIPNPTRYRRTQSPQRWSRFPRTRGSPTFGVPWLSPPFHMDFIVQAHCVLTDPARSPPSSPVNQATIMAQEPLRTEPETFLPLRWAALRRPA